MTLVEPSSSLAALRAAHQELLARLDTEGESDALLEAVERFLASSRRAGRSIDVQTERRHAQSILDYWTTLLYRHGQEPGPVLLAEPEGVASRTLKDDDRPYPGLAPFSGDPRTPYFGRDAFVRLVAARLRSVRAVTIAGAAGSGRSSLLRAGLMPALRKAASSDGAAPGRVVMLTVGPAPLRDLASLFVSGDKELEAEVSQLMHDPARLGQRAAARGIAYLLIDQLEEVSLAPAAERSAFLANLDRLIESADASCKVVLALRTENGVGPGPEFEPLLADDLRLDMPALGSVELFAAIQYPAEQVGLKFDDGVVDELVRSLVVVPEPLPLLQFALLELWERRRGDRITRDDFRDAMFDRNRRRVNAGWALGKAAASVLAMRDLEPVTALGMLVALVRPLDGSDVATIRLRRSRLVGAFSHGERALAALEAARVVRLNGSSWPQDPWVDLTHVAVVINLKPLRDAIDERRAHQRARLSLTGAADLWRRSGRDHLLLWGGAALQEARRDFHDLTDTEDLFLRASERQEQLRRVRERAYWLGAPVLIIAVLLWLLWSAASGEQRAVAAHLVDQAELRLSSQPDLALLLALHGYRIDPGPNTWDAFVRVSERYAGLVGYKTNNPGVSSLATSPTEAQVASGLQDGSVNLWSPLTGEQHALQPADANTRGPVAGLTFSADGAELLVIHQGQPEVSRWRIADDTELPSLTLPGLGVGSSLAYYDATRWAIASPPTLTVGSSVIVNDSLHGSRMLDLNRLKVDALAFSPDGSRLAIAACSMVNGACAAQLRIWDIASPPADAAPPRPVFGDRMSSLAFSSNGVLLAAGRCRAFVDVNQCTQGEALLFDTTASNGPQMLTPTIIGHSARVVGVGFLPESTRLVTASPESVLLWDTSEPTRQRLQATPGADTVVLSSDGSMLAASCPLQAADCPLGGVQVWRAADPPSPATTLPVANSAAEVKSLAWGGSGQLAVGAADGSATLWSTVDKKPLLSISGGAQPITSVAVGSTTAAMSLAIGGERTLLVEKKLDGSLATAALGAAQMPVHATALAFNPAATLLAEGRCEKPVGAPADTCTQSQVAIWDTQMHQRMGVPTGYQGSVTALAFDPGGRILAVGTGGGHIVVADTQTNQQLADIRVHSASVSSIVFDHQALISTDGQTLVRSTFDVPTFQARVCRIVQGSTAVDLERQLVAAVDTGLAGKLFFGLIDAQTPCGERSS